MTNERLVSFEKEGQVAGDGTCHDNQEWRTFLNIDDDGWIEFGLDIGTRWGNHVDIATYADLDNEKVSADDAVRKSVADFRALADTINEMAYMVEKYLDSK